MIEDTTEVSRGDGWLSAWVGTEYVMMSAESGTCISLSETGGRIWELMEEPATVAALCAKLEEEYQAPPEAIRADVLTFLRKLEDEHALKTG